MKKIIIPALVLFMFACGPKKDTETKENKQDSTQVSTAVYQCPMDCEKGKTYDKPGQCPVCGMDLEIKT
jgi:transcription initiation factor IIE alpha subunit